MLIKPYRYIILLGVLIIHTAVFAQNKKMERFVKKCNCPEFDLKKGIKFQDISKSNKEIEFRLTYLNMGYNTFGNRY